MKYYLSVGAIFRNESMIIKEWIEHYFFHGVDHIYLINDRSEDDYLRILNPYIDDGRITLFDCSHLPKIRGRQGAAYDVCFRPILGDTKWLAILDIDEYMYSPSTIDLKQILLNHEDCAKLMVNWCWFNSNAHDKQPLSVVSGFTKRAEYGTEIYAPNPSGVWSMAGTDGPKAIINTSYPIQNFGIHDHLNTGLSRNISYRSNIDHPDLLINHYALQSREYWEKVKMPRGDADCWHSDTARNWKWFEALNVGSIDDFRLLEQNKPLLDMIGAA
jgi:hypothetical protein